MKITQDKKEDIIEKSKNLEDLKEFLKKEFVGIDKVIEGVVDTLAPFYLFPESLTKPLVINLWGMTATGKTSLVHHIVEFLNLQSSFFKFEIGEYNDSTEKLKTELSNKIKRTDSKNLVLLLDEFQLGRTINEDGKENNRTALRPIWELIDSGQIAKYNSLNFFEVSTIVHKLKKCLELGVKVNNKGIVIENEDIYNAMMEENYCYRVVDFSVSTLKEELDEEEVASLDGSSSVDKDKVYKPKFIKVDKDDDSWQPNSSKKSLRKPYFIKKDMFGKLFNVDADFFNHIYNMPKNRHYFENNGKGLIEFIEKEFLDKQPLMSMEDYSQSLIFCLGNIDEAYNMTHSTNPDADADIFHEHSLKITLPKIKDALSRRFRMEQIGRLGNNHFIYPSLNKKSYERIISLYLKKRANYIKEAHGIRVKFDNSVNEIVYKEGVFPTQGVRPLLSTFNQLIDSYTAKIISDIIRNNLYNTDLIHWNYEGGKYDIKITSKKNKKVYDFSYDVELKVDNLRYSDMSEEQAWTAIHEAGHALISAVALNIAPKEVVSKTASVSEGYCSIERPNTKTKSFCEKEIMMLLGGLEAEKLIFGEIGNGGTSDLSRATEMAFNMVKRFGMHGKMFYISSVTDTSLAGVFVKDDSYDKVVQDIINTSQEKARDMLKENIDLLLKMGDHLSRNSKMNMIEVKEMFKPLGIKWKTKDNYYSFKNKIKQKIEELEKKRSKD